MLVKDYTKVYSPAMGNFRGFGDIDVGAIITAGIGAASQITTSIIGAVAKPTSSGSVTAAQSGAGPAGQLYVGQPPQQIVLGGKAWYQDPLTLGAVGLGALGLVFMLKGGGGRRMDGFAGFGRARKSRRSRRSRR
jgi:hypothetical protein